VELEEGFEEPLIGRGDSFFWMNLPVIAIAIPGMDKPAAIRQVKNNRAVSTCVPDKGDQENLHIIDIHGRCPLQPVEGVSFQAVDNPIGAVRPMFRDAHEPLQADLFGDHAVFWFVDVDFGVGEIREATAVVEVHVGEEDVFDIFGGVTQGFDLVEGAEFDVDLEACEFAEETDSGGRVGVILGPISGIDQDEFITGVYNQDVGDANPNTEQFPSADSGQVAEGEEADGAHWATVEVEYLNKIIHY
jgi:hypothetical protein